MLYPLSYGRRLGLQLSSLLWLAADEPSNRIHLCIAGSPMADNDRWMDQLAEDRAARERSNRETSEEAHKSAREITTAIRRQLPSLKARLASAAIQQTDEFRRKVQLGSDKEVQIRAVPVAR